MVRLNYPLQLILAGAGYFVAGWASLRAFAFVNASASPVWPPTGIAIAALLLGGYRLWPALFVGATGFNYATSSHLASSVAIGAGNTLEAILALYLIRLLCGGTEVFSKAPKTLAYGGLMALPTALGASIGVLTLVLFDLAPSSLAAEIWLTWWLGDLAGALVVAPLIVLFRRPFQAEALVLFVATAALGAAIFLWLPAELILALPFLIAWASMRFGPKEMSVVTVMLAGLAVLGTLRGHGIFTGAEPNQSLLELQVFLAFFSVMTLVLAAGSIERRASKASLRIPFTVLAIVPLLLSSVLAHDLVRPSYDRSQEARDDDHLDVIVNTWQDALHQNQARLEATAAFFSAHPNVTRAEFHDYVEASGWLTQYGGVQAVGYNRYIDEGAVAGFQAKLDSEDLAALGYPSINVSAGVLVDYLVPIAGNEAAFGFDISSEPTRNAAIEAAVRTGTISVTAPIVLVQEEEGARSTLSMVPVYEGNPQTEAERIAAFSGLVVSVHRGIDMAQFIGFEGAIEDIEAGVYLVGEEHEGFLHREFEYAGRSYRVHAEALPPDPIAKWAPTFILGSGGMLSVAATMAVYAYDSTQRRAQAAAERMNHRLTETQKVARLGSWDWDVANDSISWSQQLFELFGQDPETFETDFEHYMQCIHPEDREMIQGIVFGAYESGKPFSTDHRAVWPDGTVRWIHGQGEVEMGPEGPLRMMGTAQDVTERVEAEQQARHAAVQSQELANLKRVNEFKTQFLNTAAHELRTPLSPIMIQLKLIDRAVADLPVRENMDVLTRNIKRLNELINDFLLSSQFQAGRLAINPIEADLPRTIQEVRESFQGLADEKGVQLRVEAEGDATFTYDPPRIAQVLYNLMSNALKFTDDGSITISYRNDGVNAHITVADTGRGMEADAIDQLFAPFTQVHDPMSITERGSGLGLYICKAIVDGHGGTIHAESGGLGKGSQFVVQLPAPPQRVES